ncbi:MAG: tRNA (adenosine(37)-N6)-threonylcarbamoyltransferase complex dimerization subunit type 1 TsaB [Planctomycetota bacterium]
MDVDMDGDPTARSTGSVILAIETSHALGSVGLGPVVPSQMGAVGPSQGSGDFLLEEFPPGLVHGRELLPRIDALFKRGLGRSQLGLVAVSAGPGSYTGIRIGVSAAKAIAWGLSVPVLGISTLEVIASNVKSDGEFAVVLDARRGACYGARFRRAGGELIRLRADQVLPPARFFAELPESVPLVGQGARALPGGERYSELTQEWNLPRAEHVYKIAWQRWQAIQSGKEAAPIEYQDPHALRPAYLRPSAADEQFSAQKGVQN